MVINQSVLVTGIGTDVGKTLVCEGLCKKFNLPYWKPIQCGHELTDTRRIKDCGIKVFDEVFSLKAPLSPHHASELEDVTINLSSFSLPDEPTIIEGAGGLLVPLNDKLDTFSDLALYLDLPVILVTRNYLGSINHTLLTLDVIKSRGIRLLGVIVSGREYKEGEQTIIDSDVKIIGRLREIQEGEPINLEWHG